MAGSYRREPGPIQLIHLKVILICFILTTSYVVLVPSSGTSIDLYLYSTASMLFAESILIEDIWTSSFTMSLFSFERHMDDLLFGGLCDQVSFRSITSRMACSLEALTFATWVSIEFEQDFNLLSLDVFALYMSILQCSFCWSTQRTFKVVA